MGDARGGLLVAHVELHGRCGGDVALVLDRDRRPQPLAGRQGRLGQRQIREGELRIGEAVAERIQRLRVEVAVRAALHGVVRKGGQVVQALVEGDRQAAAGRELAEQQLRHGLAAVAAGVPVLHDGAAVRLRKVHRQGRAGGEDEDRGLAHGHDLFQQLLLQARQVQVRLVARAVLVGGVALLALDAGVKAQAQHDDVRLPRHGDGLAQAVARQRKALRAVAVERAALGIEHAGLAVADAVDALQDGDVFGGRAVVVALEHLLAVGVGADDRDGGELVDIQGQQAVVLEQHLGAARGLLSHGAVLGAVVDRVGDRVVGAVLVEHAQLHAGGHQALDAGRDVVLGQQPLLDGGQDVQVDRAAVDVAAVLDGQGRGLRRGVRHLVVQVEVAQRPAVGDKVARKAPLVAQDVRQKVAGARGLAVDAVVGAHDALDLRLLDQGLKGGQVRVEQVLLGDDRVELVPQGLRAGVHGKVLGAGRRLEVLFVVALQALDKAHAQARGEIGVLAVGLVAAAPARVAEDVDVRRPEGQPLVDVAVALAHALVVLGAALGGDDGADLLHKVCVEHGGHGDGLREHGGRARARHAVQRLVPPVIGGYAQPLDGRGCVDHLAGLFLQRHAGDQVLCPLGKGEGFVQVFRGFRHRKTSSPKHVLLLWYRRLPRLSTGKPFFQRWRCTPPRTVPSFLP